MTQRPCESSPYRIGRDYVRVTGSRISVYSRTRGADIILGAVNIMIGAYLLVSGDIVQVGATGSITASWSTTTWAVILLSLGALRWIALIINGWRRQEWTALIRAVVAGLAALFWSGIVTTMIWSANPISAILFLLPLCSEVYLSLRAVKEATLIRRARGLGARAGNGSE